MPRRQSQKLQNNPLSGAEAQRRIKNLTTLGCIERASDIPDSAIPADITIPAGEHYSLPVPFFAQEVYCWRDCGKKIIWTALDKYRYYKVEKGNMYAKRGRCSSCYRKVT